MMNINAKPLLVFYVIFMVIILTIPAHADDCPLFGAEYVPQNQYISESFDKNKNVVNRTLSFIMRIEDGDSIATARNIFLYFDAYKNGKKVSTMRLGDVWSLGDSRQSFSTHFGQFCNFDTGSDCKDMSINASFHPIGINKDLSPANISETPYLLIFPGTHWELRYNSYQQPENWDQYIKFYTAERVYPDFRGYDFWIRKKCGEKPQKDNK